MNIRAWLRRDPQPHHLLADEQRVEVPDSPRKWAELEETLEVLGPSRLTCMDSKGTTLRAITLHDDAARPQPAPAPLTPMQSDLQAFGRLLADAYRTGAETATNALRGSIEENTKLVKLLADRLGAIEMAWQRSLSSHAKLMGDLADARAAAAGGGGEDGAMAQLLAIAASQAMGGPVPPVPPANGKKP